MTFSISSASRGVLQLVRHINFTNRDIQISSERLATGLRINRAADDPGGLFRAEQLRAQLSGLDSQITANETAINLLNTADEALGEINTLLSSIRSSVVLAQGGTLTPDELAAEQDNVNAAVAAVNNLASATQFGDQFLLNGLAAVQTSGVNSNILDLTVRSARFGGQTSADFTLNVTAVGTRATANVSALGANPVVAGGDVTVRITGPLGTKDISVANGTTASAFAAQVNAETGSTGVTAVDGGAGAPVDLYTEFAGSSQSFTVSQVGGAGAFTPGTLTDTGSDLQGDINGTGVIADGNRVLAVLSNLTATFEFNEAGGAGAFNFTVQRSGLRYTFGRNDEVAFGIPYSAASTLGRVAQTFNGNTFGGFLDTLKSGGANDLSTNPGNALNIVDAAITDVLGTRGFIGAQVSSLFESNVNLLKAEQIGVAAGLSAIEDLDFARETSKFTELQILQQIQVATLASANLLNGTVLDLLKNGD